MIVVAQHTNNNYSGLNGKFWNWVKKHKGLSIVIATLINPTLGAALSAYFLITDDKTDTKPQENVLSQSTARNAYTIATTEPTPEETVILDAWVNNVFTPFYKSLLIQFDTAIKATVLQTQLNGINNVLLQMCYAKQYYAGNETAGLSQNAVDARLELIGELFTPIESIIQDMATAHPELTATLYIATSFPRTLTGVLKNLKVGTTVNCTKYSIASVNEFAKAETAATEIIGNETKPTLSFNGEILSVGIKPSIRLNTITEPVDTPIVTTPTNTTQATNTVTNISNTEETATKNPTKWVLGISLLTALALLLSPKKESSIKNQ